jgi:hypothetical protein
MKAGPAHLARGRLSFDLRYGPDAVHRGPGPRVPGMEMRRNQPRAPESAGLAQDPPDPRIRTYSMGGVVWQFTAQVICAYVPPPLQPPGFTQEMLFRHCVQSHDTAMS